MTKLQRKETIIAMDTVARHINCEGIFDSWLMCGVADGDISREMREGHFELLDDCYAEKNNYDEICELFLRLMARAKKDGGLY